MWIVGGQTRIADLLRDAQPSKNLHRARGNVIAFRLRRRGARPRLDDGHVDPAPGQVDGQREPDRPCPDNQHVAFSHSGSAPDFLTMSAQRSISVLMNSAKLSGVDPGRGSMAMLTKRSRVAGSS